MQYLRFFSLFKTLMMFEIGPICIFLAQKRTASDSSPQTIITQSRQKIVRPLHKYVKHLSIQLFPLIINCYSTNLNEYCRTDLPMLYRIDRRWS